jgi:hypothetical protein
MPFSEDTGTRESDKYCSLCYKNGKFCYEGDIQGFIDVCYKGMRARGMNPIVAWIFSQSVRFAPRWKK